ncbi:MAG: hypothetical protein CVU56_14395 [Deltaproteobacteria bacterium HGW-Deltaproteobacteria-14]|jgi:hypothetical protein|nr:MAG: hypothetical protein CVU56_14395 [Deltaproteobacteria bacterium HGW-Deltaproteobacteria-14]
MLKQLLEEDLIPVESLPHIVESYRRVIHEAHRKNQRANVQLGDQIADALRGLLRSIDANTGDQNLRIIQAAVRFFVIQDDGAGGHDLASSDGLDDDAAIVNAVLRFFGRDDLMIPGADTVRAPRPAAARAASRGSR